MPLQKIAIHVIILSSLKNLAGKFLQCFSRDGSGSRIEGVTTLFSGLALNVIEWKIVGVAFAVVAVLKLTGVSHWAIFLFLWAGDIVLSYAILAAERVSKKDITFMDTYRRIVERLIGRYRVFAYPIVFILFLFITLWYGPAYVAAYHKGSLYPRPFLLWTLIVFIAAIQMAVWIPAYLAGVDFLEYLFQIWRTQ